MIDSDVKWFDSTMAGAPVLSGTAGALIALLDACLVNGFNLQSVQSAVVAANVCTLTFATAHGFVDDQVILVAGATPAALNGEWRVATHTTNALTFVTTGITDQTATGTISAKAAPIGFNKSFSGTNKAAYKLTAIGSTGLYFRIDDTGTTVSTVTPYEVMTDVDTGSGWNRPVYWIKSGAAGSTARPWFVVGDAKFFYLYVRHHDTYGGGFNWFGDFVSYKSADTYNCIIQGSESNYILAQAYHYNNSASSVAAGTAGSSMCRTNTLLPGQCTTGRYGHRVQNNFGFSGFAYPNASDNSLAIHSPILVTDSNSIRGEMVGIYQPLHNNVLSDRAIISNIPGLNGKKLMSIMHGAASNSPQDANVLFDIIGPWR